VVVKTFSNWRNVGRAMRWARQQEGVIQGPATFGQPFGREYVWGWYADGQTVRVHITWGIGYAVTLHGPRLASITQGVKPAQVLRILAALELIPADIAYAADERYGRCVRCGLLAEWWAAEAGAEDRWVHAEPWLVTDHHQAEVAS
jgi:hypothetical protein